MKTRLFIFAKSPIMPSIFSILIIAIVVYFVFIRPKRIEKNQISGNGKIRYARWIGGGIGWVLGGPIGALLGFALGSLAETSKKTDENPLTGPGDFKLSLMVLTAAVMKSDGVVKKSELNYVKDFLVKQFGRDEASELLIVLRDVLKKDIDLQAVGNQIGMMMDPASKQQLLYYLFGISSADGELNANELQTLQQLSRYMGISASEFASIQAMFNKKQYNPYEILEISPGASVEEIKKAYRQAALKYHPDRVNHLGEDIKREAEEKFKKIVEAYEKIRKEKGF